MLPAIVAGPAPTYRPRFVTAHALPLAALIAATHLAATYFPDA